MGEGRGGNAAHTAMPKRQKTSHQQIDRFFPPSTGARVPLQTFVLCLRPIVAPPSRPKQPGQPNAAASHKKESLVVAVARLLRATGLQPPSPRPSLWCSAKLGTLASTFKPVVFLAERRGRPATELHMSPAEDDAELAGNPPRDLTAARMAFTSTSAMLLRETTPLLQVALLPLPCCIP